MSWLMIGLLALITFFNRFAFFSRLTVISRVPKWGFPQLLGPVGADRHLAAHRLQLSAWHWAELGSDYLVATCW